MIKASLAAAAVLTFALSYSTNARSADSSPVFEFASATKNDNSVPQITNRIGGNIWNVNASNNKNAGKRNQTVTLGPAVVSTPNSDVTIIVRLV